jgi:hypothetical protein
LLRSTRLAGLSWSRLCRLGWLVNSWIIVQLVNSSFGGATAGIGNRYVAR